MINEARHFYAFGPFRLDTRGPVLLRDGQPVSLAPKTVETLLLLVQNAGHLVRKDELMQRVWPDTFVEEGNLTKNISLLRRVLGPLEDGREYIETLPKRGYRFVAGVREIPSGTVAAASRSRAQEEHGPEGNENEERVALPFPERRSLSASQAAEPPGTIFRSAAALRSWLLWLAGSLVVVVAWLLWFVRPVPAPKVLRTVRLTHFGLVEDWERLVTDGRQLYFEQRTGGQYSVARVPAEGGEPTDLATPFPNTTLYDISADRSELLVGGGAPGSDTPLWALPTSGGSPRPLGSLVANDAAWSPDGQRIVYVLGPDLYLAKADGSESRKLITTAGAPHWPRWSPDGRVLRFTLEDTTTHYFSLWEVAGDGRDLHRLLARWREAPTVWGDGESGGEWTPDGRYFVFRSRRAYECSIWALREKARVLGRRSSAPVLLTSTDSLVYSVSPARDGKTIFFVGTRRDRELERYDARLEQFVPYLGGVRVRWGAGFSPDGQWVAYVAEPASVLWRSRVDGSDRLQLTFALRDSGAPRWSPDGKQIVFAAGTATRSRIYLVASNGGNPEPVTPERYLGTDPEWSPDGKSLLFSVRVPGVESDKWSIYRLDLMTHEIAQLPGSDGLRAPAYSPDGKYVAAIVGVDGRQLMLFDVQSQRWTELARANWFDVPPFWSRDGKYVYAQELAGVDQPVLRVRITDRKVEVIANRNQFARADVKAYTLVGLTPDGSPLVSLILSLDEIYALGVDFP
jgi:Tol biopolymer transport system component/DNA-binding winged helix-turn-helix (wHTH) protein